MIFWLIIAFVVFAVSLFVAFRSMRSVVQEDAKIFSEHLPPQPPLRGEKAAAAHEPADLKIISAHTLQADKIARAEHHGESAEEGGHAVPATAPVTTAAATNEPQAEVATQQAPQSVEEARQRLQDAIRRSNANLEDGTTQAPANETVPQQQTTTGQVKEKKYLGEYKGSIVIDRG